MSDRGLIVFAHGSIDEIDEDGNITTDSSVAGVYQELAEAGYPRFGDPDSYDPNCFDITIDERGQVTAHTWGDEPREHAMGVAPDRLAAWLRQTADS